MYVQYEVMHANVYYLDISVGDSYTYNSLKVVDSS